MESPKSKTSYTSLPIGLVGPLDLPMPSPCCLFRPTMQPSQILQIACCHDTLVNVVFHMIDVGEPDQPEPDNVRQVQGSPEQL